MTLVSHDKGRVLFLQSSRSRRLPCSMYSYMRHVWSGSLTTPMSGTRCRCRYCEGWAKTYGQAVALEAHTYIPLALPPQKLHAKHTAAPYLAKHVELAGKLEVALVAVLPEDLDGHSLPVQHAAVHWPKPALPNLVP